MSKTQTQAITSLLDWAAAGDGGGQRERSWEIRSSSQGIEIVLIDGQRRIGYALLTEEMYRHTEVDALDFAVGECLSAE